MLDAVWNTYMAPFLLVSKVLKIIDDVSAFTEFWMEGLSGFVRSAARPPNPSLAIYPLRD